MGIHQENSHRAGTPDGSSRAGVVRRWGDRVKRSGRAGTPGSEGRYGTVSRRAKLGLAGVVGVLAVSMLAAACGSTPPPSSSGGKHTHSGGGGATTTTSGGGGGGNAGGRQKGGVVTIASVNGSQPNWIWPFVPPTNYSVYNFDDLYNLLYRPLYMFGNNGNSVKVNYPLSTANAPVYTDGGKTVTIKMKGWKWDNGETVDAADVAFWINMEKAEKHNFAGYVQGTFPDNLKSYSIPSADTIVLHLTKGYASTWFTYNQLATITPMPLTWDVTKAGAKAGSGGCHTSTAGCKAVFAFLDAQAKKTSTYATNPVWKISDGPWKLSVFNNNGANTFVPNKDYSGSPKPTLDAIKFLPYTDDATAYTALKSGSVDIGSIPSADLPPKSPSSVLPPTNPLGSNYNLQPAYSYGITYFLVNYDNPTYGPVFKQLYFRQALMYVNDQVGVSKAVYRGYGYPTTGPVPAEPPNAFEPPIMKANHGAGPYPFNPGKAKSLLESHGWKMVHGVMTCESSKCGPGVKVGTPAKFTMDYSTGAAAFQQESQVYKSDASKAGIDITLRGLTFNAILGQDTISNHKWTISNYGGWVFNGPGFLPTGEPLFYTGASTYSNPEMDKLIREVQTSSSMALFHKYATYAAKQLPDIWMPNSYGIQAVKSNVHGVTFNSFGTFLPEYWYLSK